MNAIYDFLSNNIITVSLISIFAIILLVALFFSKSKPNAKIASEKRHQISKKEYKTFCENSDNAIVNTTVSFGAKTCNDQHDIDDMYCRTIAVGNKILKQEGFKVTIVRKV